MRAVGELKNIMVEVTTKETKGREYKICEDDWIYLYDEYTNVIPLDLVNIKDYVLNGMVQFHIPCVFLDGCTWKIR